MKKLITSLFLTLFVAMTARAQTATVTPSASTYSTAGGTITFTVNISYSGTVTALGLSISNVPTGWTFGTTSGTNIPDTKPATGVAGPYNFSYSSIPATKTPSFQFTVNYPANQTGFLTFGIINLNFTGAGVSPGFTSIPDITFAQGTSTTGGGGGATVAVPTITTQPTNVTVNQGQVAAFAVAASSTAPVTYQWQKNGFDIFGATSAVFGILVTQVSDAGTYTATVTNSAGSVVSSAVTLTVNVPPAITTSPSSVTANQGQTTVFSVGATGTPNPTYQWRKNGLNIGGATNSTLILTGLAASDAANYDVVVTNAGGSATSSAATLTVVLLPTVAVAPTSVAVTSGGGATFSVTAGGTGPFTYQWRKNGSYLSGQTTATLSLVGVTTADTGNYDVLINNAIGNVLSPFATLSVNTAPGIITPPFDVTTTQGQQVQFTVVVASNSIPTFQWRKNTVNITGANNAVLFSDGVITSILTLNNVSATDAASYDVVVNNGVGAPVTSPAAVLTVGSPLAITAQPASQSGAAGGSVSFSVTATGTAPIYYQWRKNGAAIAGATGATLNLTNISSTDAANYDVVITNAFGSVTSSVATLSAPNVLPAITTQPVVQTGNLGGTATFSVVATGIPAPSYQWRKNGVPTFVNGSATSATLTLSNLQASDIGSYDVVVTNSVGSIVSSAASLTVNLPPSIIFQPSTYQVLAGQNAYFNVTVSGTGPFTYLWRKNGASLAGAPNVNVVNGTNTSQLTIFSTSASDNATYDVVVSNTLGTATSAGNATLFVVSSTFSPAVTSPPLSQTVVENTSVTFSVVATGNPAPTFQWYKNGATLADGLNPSGVGIITGSATANLTITQATLADASSYYAVATNSVGTFTSSAALLTVNKVPVFTTQPVGTTVVAGGSYTLTSAVTASPTANFQWFKDGLLLPGATSSSLALTSATIANAGSYTVVATNSAGSATSTAAALVVSALPVITLQPVSASVAQNQPLTLSVAATGGPAPTYQWYNGVTLIPAATNATYTIPSAQPTDAGNYTVAVTNASGTVTSSIATVTVLAFPAITLQPVGGSFNQGASTTLSVTATGAQLSYQWSKDNVPIAGAKSASLVFPSLASSSNGLYAVVVSNPVGSVTSGGAFLQVSAMPLITTQPTSQTVIVGNPASFTVVASGNPGPSYQWSKNGVNLDGALAPTYTLNSTQKSDAGVYRVTVSNSLGTVMSNSVSLAVNDVPQVAPTITTQPQSYTGFAGIASTLTVVASGNPTPTYQWNKNGAAISGATSSSFALTGTTTESGNYTVTVANTVGTVTSSAAVVLIKPVIPVPVIVVQPASRTLAVGASATLSVQATGQGPLTYQWLKNGTAISGATTTELALTSATSTTAGAYTVTVTNEGGTTTSATANVTVSTANAAPIIVTQPSPQVALVGGSATFTVVATGTPSPVYQWRKNGVAISGATSATLTLSNVQAADAAGYDVTVLNPSGQAISAVARLTVATAATAPTITRQPADTRVVAGRSATFTVIANGTPTPTYQWRLNGTNVAGATSATLTLPGVTTAQAGAYSVVVTNSAGSVTSNNAALTVLARSYAGTWFGTLGGGTFALRVNDDNTGVFLGYVSGTKSAYVGRAVTINDDGTFRFTVTTTTSVAASPNPVSAGDNSAAAVDDLAFTGTIASDGSLTGNSTTGATLALTAVRSNDTGTTAPYAGFYQIASSGSSSQALLIVSPAGQAFVLTQAGATVDAGTGTVDATGRVSVTTAGSQIVVATIAADTGVITATVVDSKNASTTYSGFAAGSSALGDQRLANISTRASAGIGSESVIVGFVITGLESKTLLIRAVGPTLRTLGVATAAAAPRLDLARGATVLATNIGWTSAGSPTAEIIGAAARSGAFPLGATSADSVILATLPPGNYTATCSAADAKSGVALVEVYDLSGGSTAQKLANISTRALTGPGENILTAGVVVTGSAPKRVLIRAAGPVLAQFGLTGVLARPQLTLFNSAGTSVATNAGWSTSTDAAAITDAAARTGAFAFPAGSLDAALVLNLAPGNYTAQVSGVGATSGIALVEIYELP